MACFLHQKLKHIKSRYLPWIWTFNFQLFSFSVNSVQSLNHVWLFATPWTAACQASLSIISSRSLLKLMSIESVMPSNYLVLCCPLLLLPSIFPTIRVCSDESALHTKWSKYWSFSISISPSNEYSGLFPLVLMGLISLQSNGLSRVFSNTTVQKHQFFSAQISLWSNSHIHTWLLEKLWKNIALTVPIFVGKVMSLLFNMLSRFVTTFLPRNKRLLISWLHELELASNTWMTLANIMFTKTSQMEKDMCYMTPLV